jgi:hypothetical protein
MHAGFSASSVVVRSPAPAVRKAAPARLAALAAAVSLGLAASPSAVQAALVTINAQQTTVQTLGGGDELLITGTGSIETATDDGVRPSASGAAIGNIDNQGLIDVGGDGVRIDGAATLTGSITNAGSITAIGGATADANSDGIEISGTSTVVTGNISNSGTISAETDGIDVSSGAAVVGDITNTASGQIFAGESGIEIDDNAMVGGSVSNAGSIEANDGIGVFSATVTGEIRNEAGGTINAADDGIQLAYADAVGITDAAAIINAGSIDAGDDGIVLNKSSIIRGSIGNAVGGTINAGDDGIQLSFSESADITNAGSIDAGGDGIVLSQASLIHGSITNAGTILAGADGIVLGEGSTVDGSITNAAGGLIDTQTYGGDDGIDLGTASAVTGDIVNAGTIRSASDGVLVSGSSVVQGAIRNETGGIIESASDGIVVSKNAGAGAIVNAGDIDAVEVGILLDDAATVSGAISNTGGIEAARGIVVSRSAQVSGDIGNAGTIFADASVVVTPDSVSGDVSNTGTLSGDLFLAGLNPDADGIDLRNSGAIDLRVPTLLPSLISGDYTQTDTGSLAITLLSFADYALSGFSPLTIIGDADIDGELLLGFDPSFGFAPGARLTLVNIFGGRTGLFSNYADGALVASFGGGRDLFIDYTADGSIDLYAAAVPLPPTWLLIGAGLFGWRAARRRG